ncbi:hypothetical protein BDD12DRAFT_887258 [Trichophaea hybrida]|nr:hypothetical protein BDD12DRAFT_887258 [Trichophaea hybrida]
MSLASTFGVLRVAGQLDLELQRNDIAQNATFVLHVLRSNSDPRVQAGYTSLLDLLSGNELYQRTIISDGRSIAFKKNLDLIMFAWSIARGPATISEDSMRDLALKSAMLIMTIFTFLGDTSICPPKPFTVQSLVENTPKGKVYLSTVVGTGLCQSVLRGSLNQHLSCTAETLCTDPWRPPQGLLLLILP